MANICDIRMRMAAKSAKAIEEFINHIRKDGAFRAYNGVLCSRGEEFDPSEVAEDGGYHYYDTAFGCKWSFVSSFEEDCVGTAFGVGANFAKYLHDYCAEHGVGIEAYSEESGNGFEEHYLIDAYGRVRIGDCIDMVEIEDPASDTGFRKVGGFGDPEFFPPQKICEYDL